MRELTRAAVAGRFYNVTTEIDGCRYKGTWTIKQGGLICVSWGEGARTEELGKARPEAKAEKILRRLVKAQQTHRAKEQRALEAKGRRLSPSAP